MIGLAGWSRVPVRRKCLRESGKGFVAMRLALYLPPWPTEMWTLAAQLGASDAVTGLPRAEPLAPPAVDFLSLLHLKQRFADAGLDATVIETARRWTASGAGCRAPTRKSNRFAPC
jgi:hypothetical protein